MAENYVVMERKDLGEDSLVIVNESLYHEDLNRVYTYSGKMSGIKTSDFSKYKHSRQFIPIRLGVNIIRPNDLAKESVKKGLEAICNSVCFNIDQNGLLEDLDIIKKITDYEIIERDVYIARFSEKSLFCGEEFFKSCAVAYILNLGEEELSFAEKIKQLPEDRQKNLAGFHSTPGSKFWDGKFEFFKSGYVKVHRKNVRPQDNNISYRYNESIQPKLVLEENVKEEDIICWENEIERIKEYRLKKF